MTIKEQYRKERKRILNYISKLRRKGYEVSFELPKIPKKPTKGSIRALQKITAKKIKSTARKKESSIVEEFNKAFEQTVKERERKNEAIRQKREREKKEEEKYAKQAVAEVGSYERAVIDGLKDYLREYPPKIARKCISVLNDLEKRYGSNNLAASIETMGESARRFLSGIHGNSDDDIDKWTSDLIRNMPFIDDDLVEKLESEIDEYS